MQSKNIILIRFFCSLTLLLCIPGISAIYAQNIQVKDTSSIADTISAKNNSDSSHNPTIQFPFPPQHYIIADVILSGNTTLEKNFLIAISGLQKGERIILPSDRISKAIQNLWKQNMLSDIQINIFKLEHDSIWIAIKVQERPVLSELQIKGIRKGERESLLEKFQLKKGRVITQNMLKNAEEKILDFFIDKGFSQTRVDIKEIPSTKQHAEKVIISITKGKKIHVNDIIFYGNESISDYKLKSKMKETHEFMRFTLFPPPDKYIYGKPERISTWEFVKNFGWLSPSKTYLALNRYARLINLFYSSKYKPDKYNEDKEHILAYYNNLGYRDAQIVQDTVYMVNDHLLNIEMRISEGEKYYFGNIVFKGNTIYSDSLLHNILGIKKGDPYNLELLNKKIGKQASPDGGSYDISTLYMDNGYLFFQINPIETRIYNDTIDYEIRIQEGTIATIKNINISGNERTKEYVIRREIRILPGDKFSKTDLIRSVRDIANLGYFDQEKINPTPVPNLSDGTVDINFGLVEKSSDQLELSLGWGGYYGLTGTVGVTFNNFSMQNLFNKSAWKPLPTGDGQKFSIRVQANGKYYYSFSSSFTQFWLGNRKRNSFTVAASYTHNTYGASGFLSTVSTFANTNSFLDAISVTATMANPLTWPDDYFIFTYGLNYVHYNLKNYPLTVDFSNGIANEINLQLGLSRSSIDQPIFPRSGASFSLLAKLTPPYSLLNNKVDLNKWIEFHKWRFNIDWYLPVTPTFGEDKNMQIVLHLAAKYGFLGRYNTQKDYSAFERFQLGDAGLTGTFGSVLGYDIISQRGYSVYRNSDPTINPENDNARSTFFTLFNKYSAELRIPFVLSTSSTIYGQIFYEMANGWYKIQDWNPFQLRKDVGVGIRFMLPALGLIGFDYTLGIDRLSSVSLGSAFRFSFILGFEPE